MGYWAVIGNSKFAERVLKHNAEALYRVEIQTFSKYDDFYQYAVENRIPDLIITDYKLYISRLSTFEEKLRFLSHDLNIMKVRGDEHLTSVIENPLYSGPFLDALRVFYEHLKKEAIRPTRTFVRLPIILRAMIGDDKANVLNLSKSGCMLHTFNKYDIHKKVHLAIYDICGKTIKLHGKIVWKLHWRDSFRRQALPGYGVEFDKISLKISEFVVNRLLYNRDRCD